MNKVISDFASESFYDGNLSPAKPIEGGIDIGQKNLKDFFDNLKISFYQEIETRTKQRKKNMFEDIFHFTFNPNKSMIFLDTKSLKAFDSSTEGQFDDLSSKFNEIEAEFLSMILVFFINYVNYSIQSANLKDAEEVFITVLKNIGIITPYRAQVRLIRNKIGEKFKNNLSLLQLITNNLVIDTVDRFQGNEAEIIIISIVDSNSDRKLGELYNEIKRLNVSITRAKTKLILLGNSEMFEPKYTLSRIGKKGQKQTDLLYFMKKTNSKYDSVKKPAEKILSDLVKYIKKREGYIELPGLTLDYSAEN
jgi:superfamily I DNA and/or RNA helicase